MICFVGVLELELKLELDFVLVDGIPFLEFGVELLVEVHHGGELSCLIIHNIKYLSISGL